MGKDSRVGERRDNLDKSMAEGTRGDEVVTDATDVSNVTKMGNGGNITKVENINDSTKNGHYSEVR